MMGDVLTIIPHLKAGQKALMGARVKAAEDGVYHIVATTNDVDRDGDIVVPTGVTNFDEYLSLNPVILLQHQWSEQPIGRAVRGQVKEDRIELWIEFAPTPLAQEVRALYDGGFMNSFSIGFMPLESDMKGETWLWTKWELLEVSAVSIPANRFANIVRSAEQSGVQLSHVKSLCQQATGGADEAKSREAAEVEAIRRESRAQSEINTDIIRRLL